MRFCIDKKISQGSMLFEVTSNFLFYIFPKYNKRGIYSFKKVLNYLFSDVLSEFSLLPVNDLEIEWAASGAVR